MKKPLKGIWEVSVKDNDGFIRTFTYQASTRKEAIEEFQRKSGWSPRRVAKRLVRCEVAP